MNGNIECAFIGRVMERSELKTSAAGKPWTSVRLAVGDGETAQFVRCALFGELAERLASSIDKGSKLYVEGSIRLDRWRTASNEERSGLSVAASKAEPVGTSVIGRNKPAKQKPDHQASANDGRPAPQAPAALNDIIPF
ncbi:single-stranded DNA-binding protein [Hyphomicrobium sp. MC1]|uniref:single-stranded DNA-binding protein n=1 Tax=Hyphomicrobium sp. (strain MC1) TaxID=717785 RepID=UPI000213E1BC|nr:single-stranded DNA-binding protein [Hyphomicrobium sp. MC1]CCB65244.1 putative Single-stranded DNA-binding protein [Hyphomicrobium sp. MC1]